MARKKLSTGKKILLILLSLIVIVATAFHFFMTRYVPSLIRQRMNDVIIKGSDSLYRFNVGKIDPGFWGNSIKFYELHIYIDSPRYKLLKQYKLLPVLTLDLDLPKGSIENIGLPALIFRKKLNIDLIDFKQATVQLSRHFRSSDNAPEGSDKPLWQLIRPTLQSISVRNIVFRDIKINYDNIDSAASFSWEFDKCYAAFSDIQIDSTAATEKNRMLFAKNVTLSAQDVKMNTPDGLYAIKAKSIFYSSDVKKIDIAEFAFDPAVDNTTFVKHFGFQHEIYGLAIPKIHLVNFILPRWITRNELDIDTVKIESPQINIYLDRNPPPNPNSKLGSYPHQLLQRAPFTIKVKRIVATDGIFTYREKNNKNQLTGKLVYPGIRGTIDNVTNDTALLAANHVCTVDVHSGMMQTGIVHAVFKLNLPDRAGGFSLSASIANLNALQLQPLIRAMSSADIESFNLHHLEFNMTANERTAVGQLHMKYDNLNLTLNKVRDDGSFDRKGLLSFIVNKLIIYKENPGKNDEERIAENVTESRVITRSFFNFIWKTLYSSAGKIILRPVVQRKMKKRGAKQKK